VRFARTSRDEKDGESKRRTPQTRRSSAIESREREERVNGKKRAGAESGERKPETLDILAFGAHPDDVEITCGGAMIRCADQGYRVGVIDFTRGECGTRGTPEMRLEEAQDSARVMGLAVRENLGLPDCAVTNDDESRLKVVEVLRRYRPKTIVIPHWEQRHPDHSATAHTIYHAAFLAGLKRFEADGEPFRPEKVLYAYNFRSFVPTIVVDITDQFERKLEAVRCYRSQFDPCASEDPPLRWVMDMETMLEAKARHFGSLIGKTYGEPFIIKQVIGIEDIVTMSFRTM
jgi:bacillithiol biosynthesis deacetylase BshB1